jgi:hypothetical protein
VTTLDSRDTPNSKLPLAALFLIPLALAIGRLPFLPTSSFLTGYFSLAHLSDHFRAALENVLFVPTGALVVVIFRLTLGIQMLGLFRPILLAIAFNIIGIPISVAFLVVVLTFIVFLRPFLSTDHNYARQSFGEGGCQRSNMANPDNGLRCRNHHNADEPVRSSGSVFALSRIADGAGRLHHVDQQTS